MDVLIKLNTGIYRHYKGNFYLVLGVGETEDGIQMVVYNRLYPREGNPLRLRPLQEFTSDVFVDDKVVKRFTYVGHTEPNAASGRKNN